eukprot:14648-Heterococcus_DN1.PRE.2
MPQSKRGKLTAAMAALQKINYVLASYGFTDFSKVDNSSPSPCLEMAVRGYCSELKRDPGAYRMPSVAQISAEIRAAATD